MGRLGRASFFALRVLRPRGVEDMAEVDGATRYARPCRPVKPLEIIWLESARSLEQRAHRRCEVWPFR